MKSFTRREAVGLIAGSALCGLSATTRANQPRTGIVKYRDEQTYAVTHRATVNVNDARIRSLEIWLPVPIDHPEQTIRRLRIAPELPVQPDVTGQASVAKLYQTKNVRRGKSVSLEVSYLLTSRRIVVDRKRLEGMNLSDYEQNDEYETFTRPEKKIESTDPEIVGAARDLQSRSGNALEFAMAAYQWLLKRTSYRLIDGLGGAAYCLHQSHGECGDYSALFVALCRAAGIPARPVVGFWANKTDDWHVWAEFMLPSGDWIPVDPSIGDQNARNFDRSFGARDNQRGVLCKTFDVSLAEKTPGRQFVGFLQVGAWWWSGTGAKRPRRPAQATFTINSRRRLR